jgi:hypothetical protein
VIDFFQLLLSISTCAATWWSKLAPEGNAPAPRENGNMMLLDDNTAVLFGGRGSGQRFNDLHFLDLSNSKVGQCRLTPL